MTWTRTRSCPGVVRSRLCWPRPTAPVAGLRAGVSAGFMVYLSGMLDAPTPRSDMIAAGISFGSCLVLAAAALFLEYCCRVPKNPGQDRDDDTAPPRQSPFPHH